MSYVLDAESLGYVVEAARARGPALAVEYGSGASTPALAAVVGHLVSLESDRAWWHVTARRLERADVRNVTLTLARARAGTYHVDLPDGVGFALIDGPRIVEGRQGTLPQLWPHLEPGAVVFVDDLHHRRVASWVEQWRRALGFAVERVTDRLVMVRRF